MSRQHAPVDSRAVNLRRLLIWIAAAIGVIVMTVLFLVPVAMLVITAFRTGTPINPGPWSLDGFLSTLATPRTWVVVLNSVVLSVVSSLIALAVGTFLAWVATKTTAPLRRIMTPAMATLILLPALFYGLGWVLMSRGASSPLALLSTKVFGLEQPMSSAGWLPLILIITGFVVPVAYMFMLPPMMKLDASIDDAARMSGASRSMVFWTITLPLLRPSLLGVFVLMTSYSFSAFELPLLFGSPAEIQVFSTAVFNYASGATGTPNYTGAATLSTILLVLVSTLVLVRYAIVSRRTFSTISGKGYRAQPRDFGRIQWLFTAVFVLVMVLAGVLPLVQMVLGSFQSMFGISSGFTTDNYETIMSDPTVWRSIRSTLFLSALGGFIAVAIAIVTSYLAHKRGGWVRAFAGLVTWAPAAIPGVVVGLAMITAYLPVPGLRSLFGTVWFLLIGFIVVVMPIATRAVEGSVGQISVELEDAARIHGASPWTVFRSITIPLVAPSFFAGWFLGGLMISGNLSLPALLSSPALQTVAVKAYAFYSLGETSRAAALFVLLMVILLASAAVLALLGLAGKAVFKVLRARSIRARVAAQ